MDSTAATITAVAALITAIGAFVLNYLKGKAAEKASERAANAAELARLAAEAAKVAASENKAEVVAIGDKVFALGKQLDGQLSKLLAEIKAGAYAKGRLDEAADGQVGHKVTNGDPPLDKP